MEEDIDIEEHDVLDNPRIRDMFPDLSRVKTEAPDSDVDRDLDPTYEEYEQENNRFEFENYSEFDDVESAANMHYMHIETHETEDSLPPEDIYHFQNKIILGTKPNRPVFEPAKAIDDFVNSDVRKEDLPAVVLLEDWGNKLKYSSCYCNECEILFATENALDAHKMIAHSFLVAISVNKAKKSTAKSSVQVLNVARKSTGKPTNKYSIPVSSARDVNEATKSPEELTETDSNMFCNHCNRYFVDGTALIKHLYELLPSKNLNHEPAVPLSGSDKDLVKCNLCNAVFETYRQASIHRKHEHPENERQHVLSKISRNGIDSSNIQNKYVNSNGLVNNSKNVTVCDMPVPKSVLYKCDKCNIHFVSITAACSHMKQCEKSFNYSVCEFCNRHIRKRDYTVHKIQHKHSDNFTVHKINWESYNRFFCKCPKCGLCLNEIKFLYHWKQGCEDASWECKICNLVLPEKIMSVHKTMHIVNKYTRKDFIVIEYFWIDSKKRKLEANYDDNGAVSKKIKSILDTYHKDPKISKFPMNYCGICKCCFHKNSWKAHLASNCRKKVTIICEICGILCTPKSIFRHKTLHSVHNIKLHDIVFFSINSSPVIPSPPDYKKCIKCKVQFVGNNKNHICSDDYQRCQICKKNYEYKAYKLHMEFHSYGKSQGSSDLTKYETLNKMWNILYLCEECDVITDSFDNSVEHSQEHFNGTVTDGTEYKECDVCKLRFNEACFSKHQQLHTELPINRSDFLILKYKHEDLLSNKWFLLFGKLPHQKVQDIISNSIYRYTRRIKMTLAKQGQPEFSVYKCKRCNTCVNPTSVLRHVHGHPGCKKLKKKTNNNQSQIPFDAVNALSRYSNTKDVNVNMIRVIEFNDASDINFNNALKPKIKQNKITSNHSLKSKSKLKDIIKPDKKYIIAHKCARCKLGIIKICNVTNHRCNNDKKEQCLQCGLVYNHRTRYKHFHIHEKNPQLEKRNIKIQVFKPLSNIIRDIKNKKRKQSANANLEVAKVYKCPCGLHFTSIQTVEKHITVCNPDLSISKENCSKCGLLFPTNVLVSHLCKHHSRNTKIQVEVVRIVRIYECSDCNVLFNSKYELSNHYDCCDVNKGVKCTFCGLLFHESIIQLHISKHKTENLGIIFNKTVKVEKSDKEYNTAEVNEDINVLYKCGKCDIHYLHIKSLNFHVSCGHRIVRGVVSCHICGLRFNKMSLDSHISRDHRNKTFKFEVSDPNTGNTYIVDKNTSLFDDKHETLLSEPEDISTDAICNDMYNAEAKVKDKNVNILYKCGRCDLYNLNIKNLQYHLDANHRIGHSVLNCSLCGLTFNKASLNKHISRDHRKETFKIEVRDPETRESYIVDKNTSHHKENAEADNKEPNVKDDEEHILYKCSECNIHNLYLKSLQYHLENNHRMVRGVAACNLCGLKFNKMSLERHVTRDHKTKTFKIEVRDPKTQETYIVDNITSQMGDKYEADILSHNDTGHTEENNIESIVYDDNVRCDTNLNDTNTNGLDIESTNNYTENIEATNELDYTVTEPDKSTFNEKSWMQNGYKHVVFRCSICNIHNIHMSSWNSHVKRLHKLSELHKYENCQFCGLRFHQKSIIAHIRRDHPKKIFRIIVVDPVTNQISTVTEDSVLKPNITDNKSESCTVDKDDSQTMKIAESTDISVNDKNDFTSEVDFETVDTINDDIQTEQQNPLTETEENINMDGGSLREIDTSVDTTCSNERKDSEQDYCLSIVYRCGVCDIHNVHKDSWWSHVVKKHNIKKPVVECKLCGLRFICVSLPNHIRKSHNKNNFKITVVDLTTNDTFEITHDSKYEALNPLQNSEVVESSDVSAMEIDMLGKDTDVSVESVGSVANVEEPFSESLDNSKADSTETSKDMDSEAEVGRNTEKIKLFKCGACNVYYLTQIACYKHTQKHVALNDIDFIECKKCNLQFTTTQIHVHMKKHHQSVFELNDVLVEEYQPNVMCNNAPKIDIYHVKDRIQSRLISSTKIEAKQ